MTVSAQRGRSSTGGSIPSATRHYFRTRAATDNARQLLRRLTIPVSNETYDDGNLPESSLATRTGNYGTIDPGQHDSTGELHDPHRRLGEASDYQQYGHPRRVSTGYSSNSDKGTKAGSFRHPVRDTLKLGTFSGVFVPTSLNVFSILMFIRFGFVLGQAGVTGTFVMLLVAYAINFFTTLSISAVASNGTVRGGGAYYLISRSLGPEFGGSIGLISYLGFVFNTGMNVVGLVDCLAYDFGSTNGKWSHWLIEGGWSSYFWSSLIVMACVTMCFAGSAIFTRAGNGLLFILMVSIFSIPLSAVFRSPFIGGQGSQRTNFTGLSMVTLRQNWLPHLTRGAAGSQLAGKETYKDLFGILFPATGGIFAGASMSGDLKNASKSIPRGTLYGILLTFLSYALVILAMAATITRETLHRNVNVVQDTNLSGILVLLGEVATSLFSILMGIVGPAKQLQAMARDGILPGLRIFGQGTRKSDEPIFAVLLTWVLTQVTIIFDINSIASVVTMSYLMMSLSLHLACLLLKLSSAPNFRPSFHFFNQWTALIGAILSIASMFFVDAVSAIACITMLIFVFLLIHWTTPPKSWGSDVTSGLLYHQVRKYLLRLKMEDVKYWRPQILLLVNDPRKAYKLIRFANSLKKGGLFILGHVIVTDNFGTSVPEARRQQAAWTKYINRIKIKSFVNVAISPTIEWGARNLALSAGLGGMRPNIVMLGFYNLHQFRREQPLIDIPSTPPERMCSYKKKKSGSVEEFLPTDTYYVEKRTDVQSYVLVLEDMILKLQTNVAVAVGFEGLELPPQADKSRRYIDLWPVQMSAEIASDESGLHNMVTTNFDTYTLILQLGCILNTVPAYRKHFRLRVTVFVEYESDVAEERSRVKSLLEILRIEAEIRVFWLACGDIKAYRYIVGGEDVDDESKHRINQVLECDTWWGELARTRHDEASTTSPTDRLSYTDENPHYSRQSLSRGRENSMIQFDTLRRFLQESRCRPSFSNLSRLGMSFNLQTHKLNEQLINRSISTYGETDCSGYDADSDDNGSIMAYNGSPSMDLSPNYHISDPATTVPKGAYNLQPQEEGIKGSFLRRASTVGPSRPAGRKLPLISISEVEPVTMSESTGDCSSPVGISNNQGLPSETPLHNLTKQDSLTITSQQTTQHNADKEGSKLSVVGRGANTMRHARTVSQRHELKRGVSSGNHLASQGFEAPDYFSHHSHTKHRERRQQAERRERHKGWLMPPSPAVGSSRTQDTNSSAQRSASTLTPLQQLGPRTSITFADVPHPRQQSENGSAEQLHSRSIYQRSVEEVRTPPILQTAGCFPLAASMSLSFNELPSRAQHLVLNELMLQQSNETAVIFTTLPAPEEDTWKTESDSLTYLTDLEVLTQGLGPMLLVHSNSMTVTTNL